MWKKGLPSQIIRLADHLADLAIGTKPDPVFENFLGQVRLACSMFWNALASISAEVVAFVQQLASGDLFQQGKEAEQSGLDLYLKMCASCIELSEALDPNRKRHILENELKKTSRFKGIIYKEI